MENKPDVIKQRLRKKGFVLDTKLIDGHDAYVIRNPDNDNEIYTYFSRGSHGKRTLDDKILHKMSRELGFDRFRDFDNFVSCKMSEEEYRRRMKDKGLLNRKPRDRRGLFRR